MTENKTITAEQWHERMLAQGWQPRQDIFGKVVAYYHSNGAKIEGANVVAWRNLRQTPPPF